MKKIMIIMMLIVAISVMQACHDELSKVSNISQPSVDALKGEIGLAAFAKGGVYMNGIGGYYPTLDQQLLSHFPRGFGGGTVILNGLPDALGGLSFVPRGNNTFKFADN